MYKKNAGGWAKHMDFMVLDIVCMYWAFFLAYGIRFDFPHAFQGGAYNGLLLCLTLANILTALFLGSYSEVLKRGYYMEFQKTVRQDMVIFLLAVCYLYMGGSGTDMVSRLVVIFFGVLYVILSYGARVLWKALLRRRIAEEKKSLLLVTLRENAETLLERAAEDLGGFWIKGIVLLDKEGETEEKVPEQKRDKRSVPTGTDWTGAEMTVLEGEKEAAAYACREWVDEILVSIPSGNAYPRELVEAFMKMGITVHVNLSELFGPYGRAQTLERVGDMTVWTFSLGRISGAQLFCKRMLDILLGAMGSMAAVLMALVLGPAIYIHSPGPIFFSQTRVGRNGRKFKMYKFRSMYPDAEEKKKELQEKSGMGDDMMFKLEYDPRIIGCRVLPDGTVKKGIGNFIRDWSLDEFPQFFNVLKGEMSVVGTRPPTEDEWERYEYHHRGRLSFQPGITGLWQVSGRSDIRDFEEVVRLDMEYIEGWNIGKDIRIILRTIGAVVRRRGAR